MSAAMMTVIIQQCHSTDQVFPSRKPSLCFLFLHVILHVHTDGQVDGLQTGYHVASLFEMFISTSDDTWILNNDVTDNESTLEVVLFCIKLKLLLLFI